MPADQHPERHGVDQQGVARDGRLFEPDIEKQELETKKRACQNAGDKGSVAGEKRNAAPAAPDENTQPADDRPCDRQEDGS